MKRSVLAGLILLNAVLLGALLFGDSTPELVREAEAQDRDRPRGEYVMIPGDISGASYGVVYVLDTRNEELSAVYRQQGRRELNTMEPIDIGKIFEEAEKQMRR